MSTTRTALLTLLAVCALASPAAADPHDDMVQRLNGGEDVSQLPGDDTAVRDTGAPFAQTDAAPIGEGTTGEGAPMPEAAQPKPALRVTCRRTGRRFRCVAREGTIIRRTCVARKRARARRRCRSVTASASALNAQGFPGQTMPAVGRLLMEYSGGRYGTCSGTVVSRTLVLTAGHCFSSNGESPRAIVFLPGATWTASNDKLDYTKPYGAWQASNWWTTNGYQGGDASLDFGLVEIPPVGGSALSDVTGAWSIMPNISFGPGAHIYSVGYPSSGYWATTEGHLGRGQYTCDSTWDGEWQYIGSGWELFIGCTMNRGSSGGPWFVELNDGSWVIGGINNRCKSPWDTAAGYCDPHAHYMRSSYIDDRFVQFWNDVQTRLQYR